VFEMGIRSDFRSFIKDSRGAWDISKKAATNGKDIVFGNLVFISGGRKDKFPRVYCRAFFNKGISTRTN